MYCDKGVYCFWPIGKARIWFRHDDGRAMTLGEALAAYGKLVDRPVVVRLFGDLVDEYQRSLEFSRLSERTQSDRRLEHAKLRATFGHYAPHEITPADILEWKRERTQAAPIRWNREFSALSVLMSYAIDPLGLCEVNPCREVKRVQERPRTRLPSEAEITAFSDLCSPQQQLYIELKMLTGLRMGDLLRLDRRMIDREAGVLRTAIGKTGTTARYQFRDPETGEPTGLEDLLDRILKLPRPVKSTKLFCGRTGQEYTTHGWKAMWQRKMAQFVKKGGVRFTEHDLRASAGVRVEESQGREAARKLLDHKEQRTTAGYTGRRMDVSIVPLKRPK